MYPWISGELPAAVPGMPSEPQALALVGARVWDGNASTTSREPLTIRIERSRIAAIGSEPALARGAQVITAEPGSVALPGLIDAHVHMTLNAALPDWRSQLAVPRDRLVIEMEGRAEAMLRAGITTARDLGGAGWLEVNLRDRIARGEIPGPRLLCAGQPVTTPRGHCWFWGGTASNASEIDAVVQRQCAHDVDWIKVIATGGRYTPDTRIEDAQFQEAELRAAVESARARGRFVAAHCHGTAGIEHAVLTGARTLEHCSFAGSQGVGTAPDAKLADRIATLLPQREPFYAQSDVTVQSREEPHEAVVEEIQRRFPESCGDEERARRRVLEAIARAEDFSSEARPSPGAGCPP